ncbi:MAG: trypsin-like peptidase domain-containing protein [Paeniglutamicibacter terrestris]
MSENNFEKPGTDGNDDGARGTANIPPRPVSPPSADAGTEATQAPVSKISGAADQTQSLPRHSETPPMPESPAAPQHPGAPTYPQAAAVASPEHAYTNASAPGPYGTPTPEEHTSAFGTALPPRKQSASKKFTSGALIVGMVAAALLGAGGAIGANYVMGSNVTATSAGSATPQGDVVINNPENVTAVTAAAAKASPSVVTIEVSSGSTGGSGSGIIMDKAGHILTNTHVVTLGGVTSDPKITVRTNDGKVHAATLVGTDPLSDLAIIKIDAENLVPATLGSSSKLNVGDTAIAIGAPLGLAGTVTDGIVSTLNRTISVASSAVPKETEGSDNSQGDSNQFNFQFPGEQQQGSSAGSIFINVIQTDAAINHGNSGGALVDVNGNIIGVNVAIASSGSGSTSGDESGSIGVGFAIPIDYAKRIADELITNGKATHGLLGVTVQAKAADVNNSGGGSSFSVGAEVASVVAGGAGEKAGLQKGDVITGVDSRIISDSSSLTAAIREIAVGGTAEIHYTRNGKDGSANVTVGENTGE